MNSLPAPVYQDLKSGWLNVARRLQSISKGDNEGLAIVSIDILIDREGVPRMWTEPRMIKIEPKRSMDDILNLLSSLKR